MATFPTSPSVNDQFTAGDTIYFWNGIGWRVNSSPAASTGGDVVDTLGDGASLDGSFSFKEVTAPTATADYAKIYAADDGGTTDLYAQDSAGVSTKLTTT